jgi:hypothetical protein
MSNGDVDAVLHIMNERFIRTDLCLVPDFDIITDEQINCLRTQREREVPMVHGSNDYFVERFVNHRKASEWRAFVRLRREIQITVIDLRGKRFDNDVDLLFIYMGD